MYGTIVSLNICALVRVRSEGCVFQIHPDAVKPDMHTKVEVTGQPVTTPSTSEAVQQTPTAPAVQPSVALTTPK